MINGMTNSMTPIISRPKTIASGAFALLLAMGALAPAWALGGGAGCADLPDYERAEGVMQGIPSACDMSVERARAIIAAHDGVPVAHDPAAPRVRHRRHRTAPST